MLGDVRGARVLDLFAGTGALGIEALSRGAAQAVFVERDRAALGALRANLAALSLRDPVAQVRSGEAREAMCKARERRETYDLVFIDPPYDQAGVWEGELAVALTPLLALDARVVVESDRRAPLRLRLAEGQGTKGMETMQTEQQRRYGDTTITIHRRQ